MTQLARILSALEEGPATAPELAEDLGIAPNQVRSLLSWLRRNGYVTRKGAIHPLQPCNGQRGAVLYTLSGYSAPEKGAAYPLTSRASGQHAKVGGGVRPHG